MLTLALIGDVHGNERRLVRSLDLLSGDTFDLALLVGDLGIDPPLGLKPDAPDSARRAHDESVRRVVSTVAETLECPTVFVPGNHDLRDPPSIPGAVNADGARTHHCGLTIAGFGGAGPAAFGFPYEWTEDEANAALGSLFKPGAPKADILISHAPPARCTLDKTLHGQHVGSEAIRQSLRGDPPRLFVCGHIHESWGVAAVEGVLCVNAGAMGPPAEQTIAWRVAWDNGPCDIELRRETDAAAREVRSWNAGDLAALRS